ncbi:hypothetical protein [Acetobacterium sp.]|uniref:hypothetical protein n=1 Tax=Acetobacterium sp. TaxID=1872094 RepID=UPI002F416810
MSFVKGQSGNVKGRPKQTEQQKDEKEQFIKLLKESTIKSLESIIYIAKDRLSKDRFNACKYLIDKAYGVETAFLLDGSEEAGPLVIEVVRRTKDPDMETETEEDWE